MTPKPLNGRIKAALEYGPILGFVLTYLIFGHDSFVIYGTQYTGLVVVTAAFAPVFLAAMGGLWLLFGRVSKVQLAAGVILLVFGAFGLWLNDPSLLKMRPTFIYLALALILGIGLLRGQSWLQYIAEDMIPLKPQGWEILTRRVVVLFILSAAANELVWRTQSEIFWVIFETLAMPAVIVVFFLGQIGLYLEYATFKQPKTKQRPKKPVS